MNYNLNISKIILEKYLNMIGGSVNQNQPRSVNLNITIPFCEVENNIGSLGSLQLLINTRENITSTDITNLINEDISRRRGNNPYCNYSGNFHIYYTGKESPNVERNYVRFYFNNGTLKDFIENQLNLDIDHENPIQLSALSVPPSSSPAPA